MPNSRTNTLANPFVKSDNKIDGDICDIMSSILPSLSGLTISPPVASKKGGVKTSSIQLDGQTLTFIIGSLNNPIRIPFDITSFNGEESTRLTLNAEVTNSEDQEFLTALDSKALQIICDNGFIKKPVETIKLMYK